MVADGEGSDGGRSILIAYPQLQRYGRQRVKQYDHLVAKADVLSALSDVETYLGGTLSSIPAVDFEDSILQWQARKALGHGVLLIKIETHPPIPDVGGGNFFRRVGA